MADFSAAETSAGRFWPLGPLGILPRLHHIRDILEHDYDHPVCLLSQTYYTRYRREPPTTEAEARRCLPLGQGMKPVGIRRQTDGDGDLIWQAMLQQNLATGAGKMKKSVDRTLHAVENAQLSEPRAAAILDNARKRSTPDQPALADKVLKELPKREN